MANEYISQIQLPNNKTYNIRDKELIPRLKATVGHSNKNLLKIEANTQTINGVTFTVDKQAGTVTVNGTASNYTTFGLVPPSSFYQERGMILSGCTGGSAQTYWIDTWDGSVQFSNFSGETRITTQSWTRVRIVIRKDVSVSNLVFKPMIRDGSISDDTFEPYQEPTDSLIEIKARAYLNSTAGHVCKNLLDMTKYTTQTGISNIQINENTGSLSFTGTGVWKAVSYLTNDDLSLKPNNTTYILTCINNLAMSTAQLAIRRRDTNVIMYSVSLSTTGKKELKFTVSSEKFPSGWYISILVTKETSATGNADISNLMLREASISDDTFEPYEEPTDLRTIKVKTETNSPTTATDYYPTLCTSSTIGTLTYNARFKETILTGTVSNVGYSVLNLGNSTATGTAGNAYGMLRLYAEKSGYGNLKYSPSATGNSTHILPAIGGTIWNSRANYYLLSKSTDATWANVGIDASNTDETSFKIIRWGNGTGATVPNYAPGTYTMGISMAGGDKGGFLGIGNSTTNAIVSFGGGTRNSTTFSPQWYWKIQGTNEKIYNLNDNIVNIIRNGTTFTATKADGDTFTFTQQDTKNTAGSTDTSDKIFLIGAKSQSANPQTYSDDQVYVTNGSLFLTKTQDASGTADNKPALLIGSPTGVHLEFDINEIMAKGSATTTGELYLNSDGGLVYANGKKVVRLTSDPTSGQVMIADGTDGQIKSSGYTIAAHVPKNAVFTDTTYTLSTGDSNGQIKVTPNSGNAYNVNVKGLGSNAYTSTAYLPLTGGTLTGQLIMSGKRLYLKGTNIDLDEAPSSDTWSNSELDFVDKDNTRISFLNVQEKTNGLTKLEIAAQNNNHYNVIDLIIDKDGDCSYYVSDPAAFRTAIGAGTSSTDRNVAQTNSVSGKYRPIMLGYDEYDSTTSYSSDEITNKVYKSSKLSFRPDRGILGIYGPCVGNTASDLISGKAGVLSYGDKGPQIEFNSAIQDSQAGAIIYTNNDSVATGASWSFVSNQTDWNVISKRFHARTSISIGTELPQTNYTLYINGNTYATDSIFLAKTKGYYLTNSANNTYAAINDNGDNLWVGASSAQKEHHRGTNGQTYISSGWSTKNNAGNDTIFVSVPTLTTSGNTETWSHTAHAVLHNGNTSFTQTLSSGTKIGTIKINGVSTDLYCQTNTNTHRPIQVNGTEILGNNTTALNLKAGSNITLSHSSGTVTITGTNTNTTYTLSTGDSNGQIKVTPSSGNAYNVSVKGLGDRAFDSTKYLPLIGGTATGTINIKSSNLDRDGKAPTSDQTGKSLYFVDKDDNGVGRIYTVQRNTTNKKDLFISVYNASGTTNSIGIRILDDGTPSYYLSNPSAFRSAISAGSIRFLTLGDGNTAGTYSLITIDPASYVFTIPSDTKIVEFFYATNTGGGWGENIDSKRIPLSLLQSQSNTLVTLFLIGDKSWTHTYIRKRTYRITKISNYKYSIAPNNESTDAYNHGAITDLVSTGTFTITKNDSAVGLYTPNPIAVYVGY